MGFLNCGNASFFTPGTATKSEMALGNTAGRRLDMEHLLSGPGLGSSVCPGGISTPLYLHFAKTFLKRAKSVRLSQVTTAGAAASGGFSVNSLMMKPDGSAGGLVGTRHLLGQRDEELGLFESHGWGCGLY